MHFTRPRELVFATLLGFGLALLLFQAAYDTLPSLPPPAGTTLLVLAVAETVLAFVIRSRIRSRRVVTGVWIARAVALAKASSLLGALMVGVWLGALAFLLPRAERLTAASQDLPAAIIGVASAAALIAAALWLEYCCRAPEPRDRDHDQDKTG
ncbi:Protein of unknown function (DUF3180) [Saccharomonospora marina XMU15]|uniref:DUF3180 domain-containing protein n=1 Tax=Saccharomonospora marina XMU15 TaxID=882083 RepID=H5X220_9PSEU|nr:DUF3180 domain-containing protein [Saccharomonospora marina]EHR53149.1 Protein of unknown function (DUF3180) [Saccharomonospora marina XMU15]